LIQNVEASLLPSKEIRALCTKVPVAALRGEDAAFKALRAELGIDTLSPWLSVYDAKGELLGTRSAGIPDCTPANAGRYPAILAETIDLILARPVSVQELERQWKTGAMEDQRVETLLERLSEMWAFKKLVGICTSVMDDRNRSAHVRDLARVQYLPAFSLGMGVTGSDLEKIRRVQQEGERLFPDMRDPALSEKLADVLMELYEAEFDIPARTQAAAKRMEQAAAGRPEAEDSKRAIQSFSSYFQKQMAQKEAQFRKLPEGWEHDECITRGRLAAQLGNAKETIEFCSRIEDKGPPFDAWLREARGKLEREARQ
jgi:hypothetical protein